MNNNDYWNREFFDGRDIIEVQDLIYLSHLSEQSYQDIAVGPQEQFLIKIDSINDELAYRGIDNIDVTPKWNWRPGTYDKVKEYIYKRLDLHKKSKNCEYLLGRTRDRVNYLGYIHRQFLELEGERANLKSMGVSRDVDIEQFKKDCNIFVNNILTECKKVKKATSNSVIIEPFIKLNGRHCVYYLNILLSDLQMGIYSGRENKNKQIQTLPLKPISIKVRMNLRHLLNNNRQSASLKGKYLSEIHHFPYINTHSRYGGNTTEYSTVCTDKHTEDIQKSLRNSEYLSLAMNLMAWAQYYHTNYSNPYNQPYLLHSGLPEEYSKEYKLVNDQNSIADNCSRKMNIHTKGRWWVLDNNISTKCDSIICSLRSKCSLYQKIILKENSFIHRQDEIEGVIGTIMEYLFDACDSEGIKTNIEILTGMTIYDTTVDKITNCLTYYYSQKNRLYESFLINWFRDIKLFNYAEIETKEINNDELKEVMKQWVSSQEGVR